MTGHGARPKLTWLKVSSLSVDESYQRAMETERSKRLVATIAAEFSWAAFGAVVATPKAGGGYLIIDGQHRAAGAGAAGIAEVPCIVVAEMSRADQAALFVRANSDRVAVNAFALFHARVVARDPTALRVKEFCDLHGIGIVRSPTPAAAMKPNLTGALKVIQEIALDPSDAHGRAAIRMIREAWPDERGGLSALVIRATVSALRECIAEGEDRGIVGRLKAALAKLKPLEWASAYRGGGGYVLFAEHLVREATGRKRNAPEEVGDDVVESLYAHPDGEPKVDAQRRSFVKDGKRVSVGGRAWLLFEKLAMHAGKAVSKRALYDHLYGAGSEVEPKIVDVFVCKLRAQCPFPIETLWGQGYMMSGYAMVRRGGPAPAPALVKRADAARLAPTPKYTDDQRRRMMAGR